MQESLPAAELPCVHELTIEQLLQLQAATAKRLDQKVCFSDIVSGGLSGPDLIVIPAGSFEMGSSRKEFGHMPEESPLRYVHIRQPYAMCRTVIKARQFQQFEQDTGWQWRSDLIHAKGEFPVINVDAVQAGMFADWLSEQTGYRYRLPTEAEWEYAARAGSKAAFAFGDHISCRQVHFKSSFPYQNNKENKIRWLFPKCMPLSKALMAGSLPANLWGLHEMHGNVWEITASMWTNSHVNHRHEAVIDHPHDSDWLVTKGGSWFDAAVKSRSAARMPRLRTELDVNLGFRLVRELSPVNMA